MQQKTRARRKRASKSRSVNENAFYQTRLKQRRAREEYVRKVSFTGNVHIPFFDTKQYNAAIQYIETGIESLKFEFPSKVRR
jgi:hypothetical protein